MKFIFNIYNLIWPGRTYDYVVYDLYVLVLTRFICMNILEGDVWWDLTNCYTDLRLLFFSFLIADLKCE